VLYNDDGKALLTKGDQCNKGQQYIQQLFEDDTRETIEEYAPSILKSKVQKAIHQSKAGKTPGPDEFPIKLVKLLDESISVLTRSIKLGNFLATERSRSSSS